MTASNPIVEFAIAAPEATAAIVTAVLGFLGVVFEKQRRAHKRLERATETVREQVQNSHSTNLRDDMDRVLEGQERILAILDGHGKSIGGLRDDLRQVRDELATEREERRDVGRRLDAHVLAAA